MTGTGQQRALVTWAALGVVYLVWGSTYLAIRVVVRQAPPLLAMGSRFLLAGLLMVAVLSVRHGPSVLRVRPRQLGAAALIGLLLPAGGNGAVAIAEQTVPSGLAALLVSSVPLWLVCLRLATRDVPGRAVLGGTALGFAGIAVLTLPGRQPSGTALWGVLTIIGASVSWASGSFVSRRLPLPAHPFVATGYEMLTGGVVMLAVGAATGEAGHLHLATVPATAWVALAYLIVIGSLVAYSAYAWLLGNAPISLIGTYAYVNPMVAVLLGALLLSEPLTWPILVGGAVVIAGVGLVVSAERPARRPVASRPAGQPGRARAAQPTPRR